MVAINLIALWLEPGCSERLFLYGLNILTNIFFIQQISWYVPSNGEQCPNVVLFFRDTLVITTILLLNTVIARAISRYQTPAPIWIDTTTTLITTNIVGGFFVSKNLNENILDPEATEDDASLVETKSTQSKFNATWRAFAKIIDRILFVIFLIVYIIMLLTLIPESYAAISNLETPEIETK